MSTYYDLYTEIKINGKWTCINNVIKDIRDNDLVLSRTYESGSRSFFGDTSDKLDEIGMQLEAQELSEELLKARPYLLEEKEKGVFYGYPIIGISYKSINALVPNSKDKENHAFVLKDTVFAYEHGELESIWDYLSADEYEKLSKEAKKAYTYYEWNDETGWYYYFCEIIEHVDWQLYEWKSINYIYDEEPMDVRIIMLRS